MPHSLLHRLANTFQRPTSLERRRFLQGSLALAGTTLLSARAWASGTSHGRVVVVGGGFAGLAAAYELRAAGVEPVVLEARGRVGGRVLTLSKGSQHVEAGAELIGSVHPTWLHYAERFGLGLRDITEERGLSPVYLDGKLLRRAEVRRLWASMDRVARRINRAARGMPAHTPWTAPGAAALDATSIQAWLDAEGLDAEGHFAHHFGADAGLPCDEMSMLGLLSTVAAAGGRSYWTESEVYRCAEGNQRLAEHLAEALGSDAIRLKTPVAAIRHSESGAQVTSASGEVFEADAVILAVPPTLWPELAMQPTLPEHLELKMGRAIKHLTRLTHPVWRQHQRKPDGATDGIVSLTWDGTNEQPGDTRWLVCFSGAQQADAALTLPESERDAAYLRALDPLFPGIADAAQEHAFFGWPNDPYTRGGYTAPGVGTLGALRTLHEGLGRLHFAGEHTSAGFPGFMEGALQSGARAAKGVIARLG